MYDGDICSGRQRERRPTAERSLHLPAFHIKKETTRPEPVVLFRPAAVTTTVVTTAAITIANDCINKLFGVNLSLAACDVRWFLIG
jgi:hypothetical protein